MVFNSFQFLVFFPIVVLAYYILPKKIRYIWLLVSSYYFYMSWNMMYAILLAFTTLVTYFCGLILEGIKKGKGSGFGKKFGKGFTLFICIILNLAVLFFFKYYDFGLEAINFALKNTGFQIIAPKFDVILPVGISFYTFQAMGYAIDVYRDEIYAEKNPLRYALFVSFFPQLVAGPIERSKNLLKQLAVPRKVRFEEIRDGILLMLWGFFLKMVIADRIAIFVDTVYGNYNEYGGWYLIIATLLFAVQIYCDFGGYSTIAMGAAGILGIHLMENFNAPYLSRSCQEFWNRWHISLSSWFRDYLYIPLGGNRKGVIRKYLNLMIIFFCSGLWHGAAYTYVIWGLLNGLYQVVGAMLKPLRNLLVKLLHLDRESIGHQILSMFVTFVLIDFSWIFFRADTLNDALAIIRNIFTASNPWVLFDNSLFKCGLDQRNFHLLLVMILVLFVVDIFNYNGVRLREVIAEQDFWFRWLVISVAIVAILLLGTWGPSYNEATFIYFQF